MELAKDLFVIPEPDNKFILYIPPRNVAVRVTSGAVAVLQKFQREGKLEETDFTAHMKREGIIVDEEENKRSLIGFSEENDPKLTGFTPLSVTLFPTTDCNLRCVYCYASAGEHHEEMPFSIAKTAIDFVVQNALKLQRKKIHLGFHGGCEPLLYVDLVKQAVDYARKETRQANLKLNVSSATNAVIRDRAALEWIVDNLDSFSISLDGPADIQDKQRPLLGKRASLPYVLQTLDAVEAKGKNYGLRATITSESCTRMKEIADFFAQVSKIKRFHFEPLFECGRCKTTKAKAPNPEVFLQEMIKTQEYAREKGFEIYYSGGRLAINDYFCGATGRNFYVTTQGDITTCLEVTNDKDPKKDIFFVGKVNGTVTLFQERIDSLLSRNAQSLPYCTDCFAKYNCSGDCPAKIQSTSGNIFDTSKNDRCFINRGVLLKTLQNSLGGRNDCQ